MKSAQVRSAVAGAAVLGALLAAAAAVNVAVAQTGADETPTSTAATPTSTDAGSVPRMADGHPDLSGVWWGGADVGGRGFGRGRNTQSGARAPTFTSLYQPWAAEKAKTLSDKDDPTLKCAPTAFGTLNVRLWDVGAVGQIVATPKLVVFLQETYHGYQVIPTDGRPHRDDQPPSYRGESVGHWEGDTFVVDTTNFTDDTWMSAEGRVSFHSDALHIVERYRRVDANTLEIEATVEDPKVLTQPWKVPKQTLKLAPFDTLLQLDCTGIETKALIDSAQTQNQ